MEKQVGLGSLSKKVEELEARVVYLSIALSAAIKAIPDKKAFLEAVEQERQMNEANSLYSTSLSEHQQSLVQFAMQSLSEVLSANIRSKD